METEHRSAISVIFVLFIAGTMTAVAVAPGPQAQATQTETIQTGAGQSNDTAGTTTVAVSATGEAQAEPDVAVVHLESTATAAEPQVASDRLATNVSRLRGALQNATVPEDRIRTTEYNLYEVSEREPQQRRNETTRYRAQQVIAVEVANTSRAGELVDVAVANGASGVRGVEFTLSEDSRSALRNQALEAAMGSARSQAETLGATEELQIAGVQSISTDTAGPQPFVERDVALSGESGTRIDSGPVTVQATVRVTYNATE